MNKMTAQNVMSAIGLCFGLLGGCTGKDEPDPPDAPPDPPALGEIARGQDSPGRVILDDDFVYWVNTGGGRSGSVMRVAKTGGEPTALASEQDFPVDLVVDDEAVYWTNAGVGLGGGKVMRVAKTGGMAVPMATGLDSPGRLVSDRDYLYWTNAGKGVMRVAKRGGQAESLVSVSGVSSGIAIDGPSIYFEDVTAGEIQAVAKTGGAVRPIASVPRIGTSFLETDGEHVYWHSGAVDSLWQVRTTGGVPSVLFPAAQELRHFVVTPEKVFIAPLGQPEGMPPGPSSVIEFDRADGTQRPITPPAAGNWGVAVDARTVYWTNISSGTVNAVAR